MIGLVLFGFVLSLAVFAWWIAPNDPNRTAIRIRFRPPQLDRVLLLGTDNLGRNLLSRVVHGAQLQHDRRSLPGRFLPHLGGGG